MTIGSTPIKEIKIHGKERSNMHNKIRSSNVNEMAIKEILIIPNETGRRGVGNLLTIKEEGEEKERRSSEH